jgi:transcription initiation factor TFIID subunit 12
MLSEPMRNHINSFPYIAPANFPPGSNEAMQWIQQMKEKYMKALMSMESAAGGLKRIEAQMAARNQEGKTLTPEEQKDIAMKKEQMQRAHADGKRFVETFRRQQAEAAAAAAAAAGAQGQQAGAQGQQAGGGPQQAQQPQHPQQQGPSAITVPPRPTMNLQQPAQSQAMQQTEAVQAAMQAARNQQVNGGRPPVNLQSAGLSINEQMQQQNQQQAINAGTMPNMPPGQGPQANIKVEGGPSQPHINASIAAAPHIQQQMQARQAAAQGSPLSAAPHSAIPQSATSIGPPKPLTHSAAVAHAARTYSSGQTASANLMASHSHPPLPRDAPNIKTNLMPIPKQLPPGAIGPPHPVQMPPARPTYSGGPSGSGSGLMQQPAMTKPPGFTIEGDAERVLNKRKLDELVRQVTGGGEGLDNAEGLTPEVEDVSFIFLPRSISVSISS